MEIKPLEKIGLTSNESLAYKTLLELGKSNINGIADKIGLHRRTIYDCLIRLEEKGLVGHIIEEKTRIFYPINPKRLLLFLEEKKEKIDEEKKEIEQILPNLIDLFKQKTTKTNVVVYKGKEGLKSVMTDVIETKPREWLSITSTAKVKEVLPVFEKHFHKKRVSKRIPLRIIFGKNKPAIERGKELSKLKFTEVKYIKEGSVIPISIWIYANKTSFLLWDSKIGIIIEDEDTSESFRNHFNILWKIAKKTI